MLNSFVRNNLLKKIRNEVGQISSSLAPDYAFCFRILDSINEVYFYDYPAFIVYGDSVSNGFNYSRNTGNTTVKDFYSLAEKNIEKFAPIHSLFPIPYNVEMLEYNYVMNTQRSGLFSPINNQEFYKRSINKAAKLSFAGADMVTVLNLLNDFADRNNLSKLRIPSKISPSPKSNIINLFRKIALFTFDNLSESYRAIAADILSMKKTIKCLSIDEAILYDYKFPRKTTDRLDNKLRLT